MTEPWKDKYLIKDKGEQPTPQVWDPTAGDFEVQEGKISDVITELQNVLNKIIAAPATEARQAAIQSAVTAIKNAVEGTLTVEGEITNSALPTGAATGAKQDTGNTTLTAIKDTDGVKKITDPVTVTGMGEVQATPTSNTLLDRVKALLTGIVLSAGTNIIGKVGIDQTTDGTTNKVSVGNFPATQDVDVTASALPTGAATEVKQDTLIAKDFATQTTLAAVLAKIIAAPATEAKQDTLIAKDYATQTTLAAQLNITLSALRDAITASGGDAKTLNDLYGRLDAIKTAVEGAIPVGTNAIGSVDVDNFPTDIEVEGTAAHDAAASGNPIQAGGVYRVADPTLDDGDAGSLRVNAKGELITEAQLTGSNAANYESVTVANSAIGLTAGTYGANVYALITCETAQIRFRIDGTNPTASEGHVLNPGDILRLNSNADIAAFKAIRTGSVSGVIKVTYSGVA